MVSPLAAFSIVGLAAHSKRQYSNNNSRSYKTDPHIPQLSSRVLFLHKTVHSTHRPHAPLSAITLTAHYPATPSHQATQRHAHSKRPVVVQLPSFQLLPQSHHSHMPQPAQPTTAPSPSAQSVSKEVLVRANASRSNASPSPPPAAVQEPLPHPSLQKNNNDKSVMRPCRTHHQQSCQFHHLVLGYQFALIRKHAHHGPAPSQSEKNASRLDHMPCSA